MAGYLYSDLPGRLDRLGWNRFHTAVLLTLGAGWALDGFEVTVVGPLLAYLSRVFHLNVVQGAWVGSIFLLGALGGALIFSTLADRLGRKRLFLTTMLLYGLSTFATAFAGGYATLLAFRFLTGLGIGGEYGAVNAAIDEFIPARFRGRADGAVNASWSVGGVLASLVTLAVLSVLPPQIGWRFAFLFGGVAAVFVAVARRVLPESPRWLLHHGRTAQAAAVVARVEVAGGAPAGTLPPAVALRQADGSWLQEVGELWRRFPGRVLLAMALNIGEAGPYYGLLIVLGTVILPANHVTGGAIPLFYLYGALVGILGAFGVAWAADAWGRKPAVTGGFALLTVLALTFNLLHGSLSGLLVVFGLYSLCGQVTGTGTYIVTSELFPTEQRALGIGLAVAAGRVAALAAPLAFAGLYAVYGTAGVFAGMAALAGVGLAGMTLWSLYGVEGKARSLEQMTTRPLPAGAAAEVEA